MLDILLDAIIDSIKLLPFLFITYLIMEYIEHKTSDKTKETIKKSGKFGPLIGGILGIFPQCGFSVAATNFYATRIISLGTLISVYLTTSDEMIPILISEVAPISVIIKILGVKLLIGIIAGFVIEFFINIKNKNKEEDNKIVDLCEHEHCHCENGIFKSSLKHTLNIFVFILLITIVINIIIFLIGEDKLSSLVSNQTVLGPAIAGLVGLIPNCAASVIITELFLQGLISSATMISGLLVSAGVGLIVLFRMNKNIKENIKIVLLLYAIGVLAGILLEFIGLNL